jgi:uncharacterized protein YeaO (DUF488 family)
MNVRTKRAYDLVQEADGKRVLVERYWPRGMQCEDARLEWLLELAPSPELVAWYARKPERWDGFKLRYWQELSRPEHQEALAELRRQAQSGSLTLVYGSRDREHNAAHALAEFLGATPIEVQPGPTRHRPIPLDARRLRSGWNASPGSLLDWLGLFVALLAPLLTLLTLEVGLVFGSSGWLVLIAILLGFCGLALLRVLWRERRGGRCTEVGPAEERESLIFGVVRVSAYALGTILGLLVLVTVLGVLALHAGLL